MSQVMCWFMAALYFIPPLHATGKCYHPFFNLLLLPCLLIIDVQHLPSAEDLPLCQPVNQMVSLEKEGCPTCHLVETSICSGHCVTKVLWMTQPRQEGQGVTTMLLGGY